VFDSFAMPVHVGLGNHDYDIDDVPHQFNQEMQEEAFLWLEKWLVHAEE